MKSHAIMAAALWLAAPAFAHAHATLETTEAPAGATYKAVLRVTHGCAGAATRTVRIAIPEGVIAVKPMPKAGWQLSTVKGDYARSYDYHGKPMATGVTEVIWSGGELPDEFYDEFVFWAYVTELPAGQVLAFPAVQVCDSGEVAWTEIAAAGQDAHSQTHPAPTLTVLNRPAPPSHGGHGAHGATAGQPAAPVTADAAWARASAGAARTGAAYLTLTNRGADADRLVAVSTPKARQAEFHTHLNENGIMRMRKVDSIDLGAGETIAFAPGGLHVMLMGLTGPLAEGETFPITLTFEHAAPLTVEVTVQGVGAMGAGMPHKHN